MYKHISRLNYSERMSFFIMHDDIVDEVVSDIAKRENIDCDSIDYKMIIEEYEKKLKDMDEVINTETYERYKPRLVK